MVLHWRHFASRGTMESSESYALNKAEYKEKSLEYYTRNEEVWNTLTHFIGGVIGFIGLIYLLIKANTTPRIIAALMTGIGGSVPYFISATYHFIQDTEKKLIARKIDYSGVCFIIVACGAPLALGVRVNTFNVWAISFCFALSFLVVFLSLYDVKKHSKHVVLIDLLISAVIFAIYFSNRNYFSIRCKIYLALGALFCLLGLAFFGKKKQYFHTFFHILMVMGTGSFLFAGALIFLT